MKYPQLVSTPAVVKEWLEAELEGLGIDSAAYARTVLSLLTRDTQDPTEVIQSGYVLVANKFGRGGPAGPVSRQEEQKRAEVIECLRSASEDQGGIQLLVDQLISMLKQLPTSEQVESEQDAAPHRQRVEPAHCDDPVLRYETAFPALRGSSGVISLTYFSRLSAKCGAPAAAALVGWSGAAAEPPVTAVWPTALNHLSLLLHTHTAAADDPLKALPARLRPGHDHCRHQPPETQPAASTPPAIRPTAATHFQPIGRVSGATDEPPANYTARLYTRSDSGGLYLQDEAADQAGLAGTHPPQKYMVYQEDEPSGRGLAPKFKLSSNEKYCQTDGDDEVAALARADAASERDLLQLLVSGEQATQPRSTAAALAAEHDEHDSNSEVLSSLQAALHSIYEDAADTDTDTEPDWAADARRRSAFARVSRAPASHRPLYLRGGGADSLLAAVYTGVAWSADEPLESAECAHRPLYARQPRCSVSAGTAAAGYAEYGQLSSGRISGAIYQQGPTEYPALRYQLAGGGLPEVTFCQLANNSASAAGGGKDELPAACGEELERQPTALLTSGHMPLWGACGDGVADLLLWSADTEPGQQGAALEDRVLWQVRDHSADKSLDTSIWESGQSGSERELSEERTWDASGAELMDGSVERAWQRAAPSDRDDAADAQLHVPPWDSGGALTSCETTTYESLWESRDEEVSIEDACWELPERAANRPVGGKLTPLWVGRIEDCTLWEAVSDSWSKDKSLGESVWESVSSGAEPAADSGVWEWPERPRRRHCSGDLTLWEATEPAWDGALIRPPEQIWRGSGPSAPAAAARERQVCRLLLHQLGGQLPAAEHGGRRGAATPPYAEDELSALHADWEFIDENNVKNKIDKLAGDEVAGPAEAWRAVPTLRQLSQCLGLEAAGAPADGAPLQAWALEEQWRRDDARRRSGRGRRSRRSDRKRPCSYFMEGHCKRTDCKFSHDLSAITCVFWEESGCFKGSTCPFLHGYPPEDEDADSSDSARRTIPKKTFKLEKEDFPSLHNTKKLRRSDEEEGRRAGRRGCRRHKSFSDAPLGIGGGDPELRRTTIGTRGKRRRHHSKSEGVRPADAGARRP